MAASLAAYQLRLWAHPAQRMSELSRMRASNPEWDFMGRTYLVLALSNMALREPNSQQRYLSIVDGIIEQTLRLEAEKGFLYFLLPYGRRDSFMQQPPRSLFVDGEIALMLGARRLVAEKPRYEPLLKRRVALMTERMNDAPVGCAESYPDECWTFCNAVAIAAIKMADVLDGTDHSAFIATWLKRIKARLVDPDSGLLISSFRFDGTRGDGPEGSSIWMAAHCLQLVDDAFATEQYRLAKKELGRSVLGFGYAREWPASQKGPQDIDSGAVVPFIEASPGSSGLALMGAAAFGDEPYVLQLLATLNLAGFHVEHAGTSRYAASNQVGDAVMLYALVLK